LVAATPDARAAVPIEASSPPVALGLRTDRLSRHQRERWRSIVELALAVDDSGRPLHPTLSRMWGDLAASGHEVYVELPAPSLAERNTAGLFRIESVRPDGHIVAVLRLDLETIDRAKPADRTALGFPAFDGLEREGRYLEVLGHELSHAVWTLADPERARRSLALRSGLFELSRSVRNAKPRERPEILRRLRELSEQMEALEPPARAVEARVWQELVAGQAAKGVPNASVSASQPEAGTASARLSAGNIDRPCTGVQRRGDDAFTPPRGRIPSPREHRAPSSVAPRRQVIVVDR
jgi:hypothetical protein